MDGTADQLQTNVGELLALKALCIALISTHPDPDELQRVFADTTDLMLCRMHQNPMFTDKSIEGLSDLTHAINETIRRRTLHRAPPH